MSIDRIKRINELVRRELAMGLFHVGQGESVEVARISFIDVTVSRDLRSAVAHVSILGTEDDAEVLMKWLRRYRTAFQAHIAKKVALKYTPKLYFKRTQSIEKGDRVLGILNEIDVPGDDTDRESDAFLNDGDEAHEEG